VRIYIPDVGNGVSVAVVENNSAALIGCGGNYFAYSSVCDIMSKEGVSKLDFLFTPTNEKFVYSFYDDMINGFDIDLIKECQYGRVILDGDISIECQRDFTFIDCKGVTALVLFNPSYNTALLPKEFSSADYLFVRGSEPFGYDRSSFSTVIVITDYGERQENIKCAGLDFYYLEVEQNGRTRLKTAY
jgi:hypothetical protein